MGGPVSQRGREGEERRVGMGAWGRPSWAACSACAGGSGKEAAGWSEQAGARERKRKEGKGGLLGRQQAETGKGKEEEGQARSWAGLKMKKGKFFNIKFFSKSIFQF